MSKETGNGDAPSVESLVETLGSEDGLARERARHALVARGTGVVEALTGAVRPSSAKHTRWEATKALAEIHDPATVPGLVSALGDEESDIRWIAATGLIALRGVGLRVLLEALAEHSGSTQLRQGAHHVLKELASGELKAPLEHVLVALSSSAADDEVPPAVAVALRELEG